MASKIQTQQIEAQTARASNSITDANDAKSDSAPTATLTVRVDQLPKPMRIDRYVQKWLKEYPRYGFDLLASKPFEQNKQKGFVVDLLNQDKGKQIRQVIFLKDRKAVILTCRDRIESFKNTINGCNEIIRTFKWTKQNDATSQQQASSI